MADQNQQGIVTVADLTTGGEAGAGGEQNQPPVQPPAEPNANANANAGAAGTQILADGTPADKTIPYHVFREQQEALQQTRTKLSEMEGRMSKNEVMIKLGEELQSNPALAKVVIEAYKAKKAELGDPTLQSMDPNDPNKTLFLKMALMEKELTEVKNDRAQERGQVESERRIKENTNKLSANYESIVSSSKDAGVQALLKTPFHKKNILLNYRESLERNDGKTLDQVAVEYIQSAPGTKVSISYLKSKTGAAVPPARGGGPSVRLEDATNSLLLFDQELDKIFADRVRAANQS